MRIIKTLAILFVISACGGGGSNAPDIYNDPDLGNSSDESCSAYSSSIGNGSTFNCSIVHDNIDRQFFVYI